MTLEHLTTLDRLKESFPFQPLTHHVSFISERTARGTGQEAVGAPENIAIISSLVAVAAMSRRMSVFCSGFAKADLTLSPDTRKL